MAGTRLEENAIGIFIKQIDQGIEDVYAIFDKVFSQAKPEKQSLEPPQDTLFRYIWSLLTTPPSFPSLEDLKSYYNAIEANLDGYIRLFYRNDDEDKQSLAVNTYKEKIQPILFLYHVLVKYKFLLTQFEIEHQTNAFETDIAALKTMPPLMDFSSIDLSETKKDILILASLYEKMARQFIALGYLKQDSDPETFIELNQELSYESYDEISELSDLLSQLPSIEKMNEAIENLRGDDVADKNTMGPSRALLQGYLQQIQAITTQLQKQLELHLKKYDKSIKDMVAECAAINTKIAILNRLRNFDEVVKLLSEMPIHSELQVAFDKAGRLGDQTPPSTWIRSSVKYVASFYRGNTTNTKENLNKILNNLVDHREKTIIKYLDLLTEIRPFLDSLQALCEQHERLNNRCVIFRDRLQKISKLWQLGRNAIYNNQNTLSTHLEQTEVKSVQEHSLSFLERHWGKMLIGLLCGSGSGAAIGLLLSLGPASTAALCISTIVLAESATAGAVVISDHCASNTNQKNNEQDEIALLSFNSAESVELLSPLDATTIEKVKRSLDEHEQNQSTTTATKSSWSNWLPFSLWGSRGGASLPQTQNEIVLTSIYDGPS